MAFSRSQSPVATYWVTGTGAAGTVTATIPDAPAGMVPVIDHIVGSMETDAAGIRNLVILGVTAMREHNATAGGAVSFDVDFSAGLPLWTAANTDTDANASNVVQITGGGAADAGTLIVTYHYELKSQRRA